MYRRKISVSKSSSWKITLGDSHTLEVSSCSFSVNIIQFVQVNGLCPGIHESEEQNPEKIHTLL